MRKITIKQTIFLFDLKSIDLIDKQGDVAVSDEKHKQHHVWKISLLSMNKKCQM